MYPLLLTATITPQTSYELNLTDKNKRYKQYLDNLIRLITQTSFTHFVFCENSNTPLIEEDQKMIEDLCQFYDKHIEFLPFLGDAEKTKKFTRAYGDQEIMEYALLHSKILANYEGFYKLTGRYWIKNMDTVLQKWDKYDKVFIKGGLGMKTVHTCFFKTTKSYFNEHFMGKADQLPKFENHSLERLYYWNIKQSGINMYINHTHPIFSGEWGAGGMMDESPLMQLKTKIFAYLGVYNIITTS